MAFHADAIATSSVRNAGAVVRGNSRSCDHRRETRQSVTNGKIRQETPTMTSTRECLGNTHTDLFFSILPFHLPPYHHRTTPLKPEVLSTIAPPTGPGRGCGRGRRFNLICRPQAVHKGGGKGGRGLSPHLLGSIIFLSGFPILPK